MCRIPLCNEDSFLLLTKIYSKQNTKRLKEYASCLTGEVDMTFGKKAIIRSEKHASLFKGVQIDKYILKTKNEDISQGDIEYLNKKIFRNLYSGKKLLHSKKYRIAMQELTGVN